LAHDFINSTSYLEHTMIFSSLTRYSFLGYFLLLLAGVLSTAQSQTTALSVDDLAKQAELVAVARVADMKSEWSADKTHIITRVTLSVQEYVKGGDGKVPSITVTTLGGEVGEVGELYTHVPTFQPNETVVVFVEKDKQGSYRVSGGIQGKYSVEADPVSGSKVVAGKYTLEEFTSRVRAAAVR
jgi:hypothetical protein